MLRFHGLCVAAAVVVGLSGAAKAGPLDGVPFNPRAHTRIIPSSWVPPETAPGRITEVSAELDRLDLPTFAVLIRGEDLDPRANLIEMGDALDAAWQKQGMSSSRHALMLVAWSEDCWKPRSQQRAGHARCDYAFSVGWSLRNLGILPARDHMQLASPFLQATNQSPHDILGGINKTMQGIAALEAQRAVRAQEEQDGSRPRALASLDRSMLLARHITSEGGRDDTLQRLLGQAAAARDGSVNRITDADESLRAYLDSLMRIGEIQNDRKTQKIVGIGTMLAVLLMLLAFIGLRARRRWEVVRSIADPVRLLIKDMRTRCNAALQSVTALGNKWASTQNRVGDGPKTLEFAQATSNVLQDLRAIVDAMNQHLRESETLMWQVPIQSILRLISPCPAQAMDRQLRKAFSVSVGRSEGFSLVFNSDRTRIRLTMEEAEKHVADMHKLAESQLNNLVTALDSSPEQVLESCSKKRLQEVAARAAELGVPPIWYSTHTLKGRDVDAMQQLLGKIHSADPVAAMTTANRFQSSHDEVMKRVETVGGALAGVAARRTPNIMLPPQVKLDQQDDPQFTTGEAEANEVVLARLTESPDNPEDTRYVEMQAAAVIRLYSKALAQYDAIMMAQNVVGAQANELQTRLQVVSNQIMALAGRGNFDSIDKSLATLHFQSASHGLAQALAESSAQYIVRASRILGKVRAEMEQAERCLAQAGETQPVNPTDTPSAHAISTESLRALSRGSRMLNLEESENTDSGGGSAGGSGTSSGGGSAGGSGTSSGGGSKLA